MEKAFKIFDKLASLFKHADKVLHFIVGFIVAIPLALAFDDLGYGFATAFLIGLAKEFMDHQRKGAGGVQTWLDWIATILGGAFAEWVVF